MSSATIAVTGPGRVEGFSVGDKEIVMTSSTLKSPAELQVLTIPENFADLYHYPALALNAIRSEITDHLPVQLEAPAKVSLFV